MKHKNNAEGINILHSVKAYTTAEVITAIQYCFGKHIDQLKNRDHRNRPTHDFHKGTQINK